MSERQEMEQRDPRMSGPTLRVLKALLEQPGLAGAGISRATGVGAGTLYPILHRLERAGWATSEWELVDPREAGRPRRRFYALTPMGSGKARRALSGLQVPGLGAFLRAMLAPFRAPAATACR